MKVSALLFLLLVPVMVAPAQTTAPFLTADTPNGRAWSGMNDDEKTLFLYGYSQGLSMIHTMSEKSAECKISLINMWPEKLTTGEIRDAVDYFYKTPENMPIPIPFALMFVTMKAEGALPADLNRVLAGFRKLATESK